MNTGDAELISQTIDEVFEPDVKQHTPFGATGVQALQEVFARPYRAFPDLHTTVEDLTEEDDQVAGRDTVAGTHQGEYNGLSPTGKSVSYRKSSSCGSPGGRIAEIWRVAGALTGGGGDDDDRGARLRQRQGQGRARLGAALSVLAAGF